MSEEIEKSEKEIEKLSAIRDIIFGNEIKEYNEEFSDIKNVIDTNKSESNKQDESLHKKIEDLSAKMDEGLEKLNNLLTDKINTLSQEKTDRQKLGDLLVKIGQDLKS